MLAFKTRVNVSVEIQAMTRMDLPMLKVNVPWHVMVTLGRCVVHRGGHLSTLLKKASLERIGEAEIRGMSAPITIHTLART